MALVGESGIGGGLFGGSACPVTFPATAGTTRVSVDAFCFLVEETGLVSCLIILWLPPSVEGVRVSCRRVDCVGR